jgi:tetratricopeptide (TPR) repeat protein
MTRPAPLDKRFILVLVVSVGLIAHSESPTGLLARNLGLSYFLKYVEGSLGSHALTIAERSLCVADAKLESSDHTTNKALGGIAAERGDEEDALAHWRRGGVGTTELIIWGQHVRYDEGWTEARFWYRWSAKLDRRCSDCWVFVGKSYEAQEKYELAIDAYEHAISLDSYSGELEVGKSTPYLRIGLIYLLDLQSSDLAMTRSYFDKAVALRDFGSSSEAYSCYFWRGQLLLRQELYIEAIQMANKALKFAPNGADARALLAKAHYRAYGDFAFAEAQLKQAVSQAPEYFWSYYHLGKFYEQNGKLDAARQAYEDGLEAVPKSEKLMDALEHLDN